jgi:hypothetical protein
MGKKRPRAEEEAAGAGAAAAPLPELRLPAAGLVYVCLRAADGDGDEAHVGVFLAAADASAPKAVHVLFADAAELDDDALGDALAACGPCAVVARRAAVVGGCAFRAATVAFAERKGAKRALALGSSFPASDAAGAPLGLRGWLATLEGGAAVDQRALQAAVDGYMGAWDAAQSAKEAAVASLAARMESDGFTLVTKGRRAKLDADDAGGGPGSAVVSDNVKRKAKRGAIAKGDFYAFQARESRLDSLAELRRKFDEDRERVKRIKEARTFRPY